MFVFDISSTGGKMRFSVSSCTGETEVPFGRSAPRFFDKAVGVVKALFRFFLHWRDGGSVWPVSASLFRQCVGFEIAWGFRLRRVAKRNGGGGCDDFCAGGSPLIYRNKQALFRQFMHKRKSHLHSVWQVKAGVVSQESAITVKAGIAP